MSSEAEISRQRNAKFETDQKIEALETSNRSLRGKIANLEEQQVLATEAEELFTRIDALEQGLKKLREKIEELQEIVEVEK